MAQEISVYLFLGFLESGKTRFIQETLEDERMDSGERTHAAHDFMKIFLGIFALETVKHHHLRHIDFIEYELAHGQRRAHPSFNLRRRA